MNKVKDYLDLGLEFVEGDVRTSWVKNHGDVVMHGCLIADLQSDWQVLGEEIKEFAWRKNTGEKPGYKGEIEVINTCNGKTKIICANDIFWSLVGECVEWRPVIMKSAEQELNGRAKLASDESNLVSLDDSLPIRDALEKMQKEAKPIYTKEMQEAEELVPVGADVEICDDEGLFIPLIKKGDIVKCVFHSTASDDLPIEVYRHDSGVTISITKGHIKPIQTEQEKLAASIRELAASHDSESAISDCLLSWIADGLIEEGYKK